MKLGADKFNIVNRSLSLGLQLEITVVLLLGHFFAILVFLPYSKALEPSTNTSVAQTAPNNMPVTDTMAEHNFPADKYIVANTFHIYIFLLLHLILDISQNFVADFLLNPRFTPLNTFKNLNMTIFNSNLFIFIILM